MVENKAQPRGDAVDVVTDDEVDDAVRAALKDTVELDAGAVRALEAKARAAGVDASVQHEAEAEGEGDDGDDDDDAGAA